MSSNLVSLSLALSFSQLAKLLIKNEKVKTVVGGTEKCTLNGSSTYIKEPDLEAGGVRHIFHTSADLRGEYLWVKVVLNSKDNIVFNGFITFEDPTPPPVIKKKSIDNFPD